MKNIFFSVVYSVVVGVKIVFNNKFYGGVILNLVM